MEFEHLADLAINDLFKELAKLPVGFYDDLSYSFINFFASGICSAYYMDHDYDGAKTEAQIVFGETCPSKKQVKKTRDICIDFYKLGFRAYEALGEHLKRQPGVDDVHRAVGYVSSRLGRNDYISPAVEQLFSEQSTLAAAN